MVSSLLRTQPEDSCRRSGLGVVSHVVVHLASRTCVHTFLVHKFGSVEVKAVPLLRILGMDKLNTNGLHLCLLLF